MKIAYFINQYPKVSHSFIRREILALERQGVEVLRLALRGWRDELVDPEDQVEQTKTRYILRRGGLGLASAMLKQMARTPIAFIQAAMLAWRMGRGSDRPLPYHLVYLAEACCVIACMRSQSVAHLHAHFGTNSAEVAMLVSALAGTSYSFTAHGPEEFDHPSALHLREKIEHSAFTIAVSSFGRSQLYRWVGHEHWHKIQVVHCGLDKDFHAGADATPLTSARRLVCVGRLCEQKGQLILLEALRVLKDQGVRFELVLAGDGEMRPEVETLVSRYGLSEQVRITGWIGSRQVREELLGARAMVLPSFAEGLPVVIMEAMALGRPVISTSVAGIPELVRPGLDGWLVAPGDVGALAGAIAEALSSDIQRLQDMGRSGRQRVNNRHDIDVEAAKLVQLFRGVG